MVFNRVTWSLVSLHFMMEIHSWFTEHDPTKKIHKGEPNSKVIFFDREVLERSLELKNWPSAELENLLDFAIYIFDFKLSMKI